MLQHSGHKYCYSTHEMLPYSSHKQCYNTHGMLQHSGHKQCYSAHEMLQHSGHKQCYSAHEMLQIQVVSSVKVLHLSHKQCLHKCILCRIYLKNPDTLPPYHEKLCLATYDMSKTDIDCVGVNDTSTLMGHFMLSSAKGRREIEEIAEELKEGCGGKRKMHESEETEEIKTFPSTLTCSKDSRPCPA